MRRGRWTCGVALAALLTGASDARADNWTLRIATWNLLNFGDRKAGLNPIANKQTLLTKYATVIAQYDIVILQEILDNGASVSTAIAGMPQMANYNCQTVSASSGRIGRRERYAVCYANVRPPNAGALVLTGTVDYMTQGGPYTAVNGSQQNAQNVWMRPPFSMTFTFTPPPGNGNPYTFGLFTSHTKPSYGGQPRPAGTPVNAAANSSVYNELLAAGTNQVATATNAALLGDLNADCASYPQAYRGLNYPGPFTWYVNYGEKTNTAALSSCAYDRVIVNTNMNTVYRQHGIYTQGIAAPRLDNERVSDHHLVWFEIGRQDKRPLLLTSVVTTVPIPQNKRARHFKNAQTGGTPVTINAVDVTVPSSVTPMVYVIAYNQANYFKGNQTIPLTDVRGSPTAVTVSNGSFTANVVWPQPVNGAYSVVLDVNGDGKYDKYAGDVATYDNEIDFIVDNGTFHSPVMSLDDNGTPREIFNENVARHVYALANGLVAGANVSLYVVSTALLPQPWPGWDVMRQRGTLNLAGVSAPVNVQHGPLIVPSLTIADKVQSVLVDPNGTLFVSAWTNPYTLFNMRALQATPPVPDYRVSYDDQDGDEDPCENAWDSTDTNFQAVCNVGSMFLDTYGTQFNLVIDIDNNGVFGNGDLVDLHDLGDMATFFSQPSNTVLDARANGNPAVGEYKELLESKLALNPPLSPGNIYDAATGYASTQYLCTPSLSKAQFTNIVTPAAQVGFVVLDQENYATYRSLSGGIYQFIDTVINNLAIPDNTQACMVGDNVTLTDATVGAKSQLTVQANKSVEIQGTVTSNKGSTACLVAASGLTVAAGAGVAMVVDPEPFSKAGLLLAAAVAGAVNITAGLFCTQ